MEHCIIIAKQKGINKLLLYSNRKLLPAIYLYEKFGFEEVPLEEGIYERADIKMEKIIQLILNSTYFSLTAKIKPFLNLFP